MKKWTWALAWLIMLGTIVACAPRSDAAAPIVLGIAPVPGQSVPTMLDGAELDFSERMGSAYTAAAPEGFSSMAAARPAALRAGDVVLWPEGEEILIVSGDLQARPATGDLILLGHVVDGAEMLDACLRSCTVVFQTTG